MATDPLKIIEQQLKFLEARSEKNLLTYDECVQLATLIKAKEFIQTKSSLKNSDDDYADLTADELKQILKVLSNDSGRTD